MFVVQYQTSLVGRSASTLSTAQSYRVKIITAWVSRLLLTRSSRVLFVCLFCLVLSPLRRLLGSVLSTELDRKQNVKDSQKAQREEESLCDGMLEGGDGRR